MKAALRLIGIVGFLALAAVGWFYLYTHSRVVSVTEQNSVLSILKDFKQIDSNWNADILKSQAELIRSYDALARPIAQFRDIFGYLDKETKRLNDPKIQKGLDEIKESLNVKIRLVDRFKAQNSLLKNSLRYTPTAHKDIQAQLHEARDRRISEGTRALNDAEHAYADVERVLNNAKQASSEDAAKQIAAAMKKMREKSQLAQSLNANSKGAFTLVNIDGNVSALVNEALRYNSAPDDETAYVLKTGILGMQAAATLYPDVVREPVNNLMAHLGQILKLRTKQVELLREVSLVPVAKNIDELSTLFTQRFDAQLNEQFKYQRYLLIYSAATLILVFLAAGTIAYRNKTERKRLAELVQQQTLELKENEAQLVHAQKMTALGEMVAGITHEVNTPLAAVKSGLQSSADLLGVAKDYITCSHDLAVTIAKPSPTTEEEKAERKAQLRDLLQLNNNRYEELASFDTMNTIEQIIGEGMQNVDYIHQVVVNMLNFSRLDRSKISTIQIEEGINSTLRMAKHMLGKVEIVKKFGETKPINCDLAQVNQVLLNLIKNAAQAMPPEIAGRIEIETSMYKPDKVRVKIVDNGAGIPDEIKNKIWDPFFTTKKEGAGTGLGLSTCRKIIQSHGGDIQMQSKVGVGTTFVVILPVTPPDSLYEDKPLAEAHA